MNRAQMKLENIKSIVRDMLKQINNSGYIVDLTFAVEELACELDLDITFDADEIKALTKAGFKLLNENQQATKIYRNVTVSVEKDGYCNYTLSFGKSKSKFAENETDELSWITNSRSRFFSDAFSDYKDSETLKKY